MPKRLKPIPKFRSEAEERRFWETHDSADYLDWSKAAPGRFPNLRPSTKSISLRLPLDLLERIKIEANRRDVPYQSLIKVWLEEKGGFFAEKAKTERVARRRAARRRRSPIPA